MNKSLAVPEEVHAQLKEEAERRGVTLQTVINERLAGAAPQPESRKFKPEEKRVMYFIESFGGGILATTQEGVILFDNPALAQSAVRSVRDENSRDGKDGPYAGHCVGSCRLSQMDTRPLARREHKMMDHVPLAPGAVTQKMFREGIPAAPVDEKDMPQTTLIASAVPQPA